MQDSKTHQTPARLAVLFRILLAAAAAVGLLLSITPAAQAAETGPERPQYVIPLGQTVGIKLFSQGVLVVGLSDLETPQGLASPAKACGLREGDVITHIEHQKVQSIEEVQAILETSRDRSLHLTVLRDDHSRDMTIQPAQDQGGGDYKLGAWIRDSMAGIGTLTFVDPKTGLFGTLGHGINDVDTAVLMKLQSGAITPASVAGVVRGKAGSPGELRGCFSAEQDLGTLFANTEQGVFGYLKQPDTFPGKPIPIAQPSQVHPGPAKILSNVSGTKVQSYDVELIKLYPNAADTRDLMLQVTDPKLLDQTGGIVQGMSGSPIIQDGKLIGAVTHVLVNDPTRGYGILIETMLDAAEHNK